MNLEKDSFLFKLKKGPALLFLGQQYLKLETGRDPFLHEVSRKFPQGAATHEGYATLIREEGVNYDTDLPWLVERSRQIISPEWLAFLSEFAWSGIYTSAIDTVLKQTFRKEWREIYPIYDERVRPIDPCNRLKLHCTYLFGSIEVNEETKRPPLRKFDLVKRKGMAGRLLNRLAEDITPIGVLMIEGYSSQYDWITPEMFFEVVSHMLPGQVYLFSVDEATERNEFFAELKKEGKLVCFKESLRDLLAYGEQSGLIQLRRPDLDSAHTLSLKEQVIDIPLPMWNNVSSSAIVLDDVLMGPSPKISDDKRYEDFLVFLGESGSKPIWSGYSRQFAFNRDYEKKLYTLVMNGIKTRQYEKPIILRGQSGTGKTMALGALAYRIRKEQNFPVLYIERHMQSPDYAAIDSFCLHMENSGAACTLIIWDGMMDYHRYHDMLRYFTINRGRKIILVASAYKPGEKRQKADQEEQTNAVRDERKSAIFVEAPAELTPTESLSFMNYLNQFSGDINNYLQSRNYSFKDETFLVALYRALPSTRTQLSIGISEELKYSENKILSRVQTSELSSIGNSALALALLNAKHISEEQFKENETRVIDGEALQSQQLLTRFVIVPGQFGYSVPLGLLSRSVGKMGMLNIAKLIADIDILRWDENERTGHISIGVRHQLEAELIVAQQIATVEMQLEFIKTLILSIINNAEDSPEVQFIVDLVRSIGPNGQPKLSFSKYFKEISGWLKTLRTEYGIQNPRLMLQEAVLLREHLRTETNNGSSQKLDLLEQTASMLVEALQKTDSNPKLRVMILAELSSVLGTKQFTLIDEKRSPEEVKETYRQIQKYTTMLSSLDSSMYHGLDILVWTSTNIIETDGILSVSEKADASLSLLSALDSVRAEDFDISQHDRLLKRRTEVGKLLGIKKMSEEALRELDEKGSSVGYMIRAINMMNIDVLTTQKKLTDKQRASLLEPIQYLNNHLTHIQHDNRSLSLLLSLWWKMKTGKPMFYKEKESVALENQDWMYCANLIRKMSENEPTLKPTLKYMEAVAYFHMNLIGDSLRLFRDLDTEGSQQTHRRRLKKSYIACNPSGDKLVFNGEVAYLNRGKTRGELRVEELNGKKVAFIPNEFHKPDIKQDEPISHFYITFNFRGPLAVPSWSVEDGKE